jgi:antirestriction protein ArdC
MNSTTQKSPHRTPDEMRAQAEALHASITDQVLQLRDSDQWIRFLNFTRSFHAYSFNNVLLILAQHLDATAVAGFRAWQQKGRQVRKGEHGIRIFGYSTKTITSHDDEGNETEHRIPRFPILTVFDINQTDPIDGAETIANPTRTLEGADDHGIIATLTDYLTSAGWTVTRADNLGTANGYADPVSRRVALRADLSAEQAAKTLIHETAHILLGHTDNLTAYQQHRGLMETEAESVAYVVAGLIGFDTSAYSIGYITGWTGGDTTLIAQTAARVLTTSDTLITILESDGANCTSPVDAQVAP